jgi:hypothetical protein
VQASIFNNSLKTPSKTILAGGIAIGAARLHGNAIKPKGNTVCRKEKLNTP